MKKYIKKISVVIAFTIVLLFNSCSNIKKLKDINVTSAKVEAIAPQGLTGLNVYLAVGIENPSVQIALEEINGDVKHSGKILGRVEIDPFVLNARSSEIYRLRALVRLGEDATLRDLLKLTDMSELNKCTVDISARPRLKNGLGAPVSIKDIPLKKLLQSAGNE